MTDIYIYIYTHGIQDSEFSVFTSTFVLGTFVMFSILKQTLDPQTMKNEGFKLQLNSQPYDQGLLTIGCP